jgi:type I restriction enzyme R subunit
MRFTEERLEQAIIELLEEEDYRHVLGRDIARKPSEVLIKEDLRHFLAQQYAAIPDGNVTY